MDGSLVFGYLLGVVIVSVIFGLICSAISSSRGMEGGFWWGFFLWLIGIIIVAVRPNESRQTFTTAESATQSQTLQGGNANNSYDDLPDL